jgi:hypothetical protein
MRTDCTRDNVAIQLPNASHLGCDLWKAKRGNWVRYRRKGAHGEFGRVIGRVHADGKTYVEIVAMLGALDCLAIRWIDATDILQCLPRPPRIIFDLICGEWTNPGATIAAVIYGIKTKA